jgi:23S rRNA (guanosine2251-2'-O)-methyltransferase
MSLWIYGINPVNAVLKKRPNDVKEIIIIKAAEEIKQNERLVAIAEKAKKHGIKVRVQGFSELNAELKEKANAVHQRVFAFVVPPKMFEVKELLKEAKSDQFFLMLDGITDVHNIGAITRTAAAMGVDAIILPKDRTVTITADVYKTSSGAIESIKIATEVNLVRAVEQLKEAGFWIYGFEEDGKQDLYKADLKGKVCCIVGGEDTGIRRLLKENCDAILKIPMKGDVQSLNSSVSAGIVIYEVQRQRA